MGNQLILGFLCIVLLVGYFGNSTASTVAEENTGTWTEKAKDKGEGAQDAAINTKDTLANTAADAGDVVSEKSSEASEKAGEPTNWAYEKVNQASQYASEKGGTVKEAVVDALSQGKAKLMGADDQTSKQEL